MTDPTGTAEDRALDALVKILEASISPEMTEAQLVILRRLALAGDIFPSRLPAPRNISEVGGLFNLVAEDPVLRAQMLASVLGVAGPNPAPGLAATPAPLYLVTRANDRPSDEPARAATPVQVRVRSDFVGPFDALRAVVHELGATLPLLAADAMLPPHVPGGEPPTDLLPYLGRVLTLMPRAALVDPATDPLAVGQLDGAGPQLVLARQLDPAADRAGSVASHTWALWKCDDTVCSQSMVTDAFVDLAPILSAAGWTGPAPLAAPVSLGDDKGWNRWANLTGLVPGRTRFGDELLLLYSPGQVAASSVRERQDWVWDGAAFVAPAA
ncbi:MAG TPA: hypothetical protein VFM55_00650 [Micromonosporaceae bacterium]|nr:hypothetical protein [Micromonosporaceae bacterium]